MENQTGYDGSGHGAGFRQEPAPINLPNANTVLILGILSILFCWWHFVSVAGMAMGVVALILAHKEFRVYNANPAAYTVSSLNNVRTGRTCAIIGLGISILVFTFVMLLLFGLLVSLPFWGMNP
ncbi:MAG TPA: CCC motif membrane protein [Bacteroidales bacterium]|nr:CCC motif membrane protein [Bacteroidales bacterium]HPS62148.1 CCC motif membrane protein [Bacteroidales bacterium]